MGSQLPAAALLKMSLGERLNEILVHWRTEDIHRRDASLPVWEIGRPGLFARHRRQRREAVASCRGELLSALLAADGPIFVNHQEPPNEYVGGDWQRGGGSTWLLPPDLNVHDPMVERWFSLGDWCFYSAPAPVTGSRPDVFRCGAAEILDWMKENSVAAWIESFHDDTDWVVALGTA
jgi:hypothetical protein